MSYRDALNLQNAVTRTRTILTPDGKGGQTSTTATVTLSLAALWQAGASRSLLSDQLMAISSHVLACLPDDDVTYGDVVGYGGINYTVVGHSEDVMHMGEIRIAPLQRVNQ